MKRILFHFIFVLVVASILIIPGCKKANDITGVWFITTYLLDESFTDSYTFVGNEYSGEVLWEGQVLGTYSIVDNNISFTLEYINIDDEYTVEVYNGFLNGNDYMSGDIAYTIEGYATIAGTWIGER